MRISRKKTEASPAEPLVFDEIPNVVLKPHQDANNSRLRLGEALRVPAVADCQGE